MFRRGIIQKNNILNVSVASLRRKSNLFFGKSFNSLADTTLFRVVIFVRTFTNNCTFFSHDLLFQLAAYEKWPRKVYSLQDCSNVAGRGFGLSFRVSIIYRRAPLD